MRGARRVEFAGGRIASRLARAGMRAANRPTLRGTAGMPTVTGGNSISISHARHLAVALASADPGCSIGVDIQALDEEGTMPLLAERILSEEERAADRVTEAIPLLRRLSLKEAAYKALFPRFGHVRLREIVVLRERGGGEGYRIVATGDGACSEPITVCDVTKPFTNKVCGGKVTWTHIPTSDRGGDFIFHFDGGKGFADAKGNYVLHGPEEEMSAIYTMGQICGQAAGMTACAPPRTFGSFTWTQVEDCKE